MTRLLDGHYITKNGSTVEIRGNHTIMNLDWFEEDSCENCEPDRVEEGCLIWYCDECDGGSAELRRRVANDE